MSKGFVEQLVAMAERRRRVAQGEHLFHRGDRVRFLFVVDEGAVELVRPQPNGAPIVLQRAGHHDVLAEASLYSQNYHCDAVAISPSVVFAVSRPALLARLRDDSTFGEMWSAHLASEVQSARYRSEILTRKTVAERLDAWLDWHGVCLPPKGEWKGLAARIGVSPEALYRELGLRRSTPPKAADNGNATTRSG